MIIIKLNNKYIKEFINKSFTTTDNIKDAERYFISSIPEIIHILEHEHDIFELTLLNTQGIDSHILY